MSDKPKSTDHGHIRPAPREPKKPVVIPRIFRGRITKTYSDIERNETLYGMWQMRALKDVQVYGHTVTAGSTFKIAGNVACSLAQYGDAVFIDERLDREKEIVAEMEKLGLNQPAQVDPINFERTEPAWKVTK